MSEKPQIFCCSRSHSRKPSCVVIGQISISVLILLFNDLQGCFCAAVFQYKALV